MNTTPQLPQPAQAVQAQAPQVALTYQAPRVSDLGTWTQLTLVYSASLEQGQRVLERTFGGRA